jgi:hypothetical protein
VLGLDFLEEQLDAIIVPRCNVLFIQKGTKCSVPIRRDIGIKGKVFTAMQISKEPTVGYDNHVAALVQGESSTSADDWLPQGVAADHRRLKEVMQVRSSGRRDEGVASLGGGECHGSTQARMVLMGAGMGRRKGIGDRVHLMSRFNECFITKQGGYLRVVTDKG